MDIMHAFADGTISPCATVGQLASLILVPAATLGITMTRTVA